jgi:hypothetical protein
MARFGRFGMNEEDEAFEELSRKQGYWGMQGSRKHQIMRYAENVESKGTSMTDKEAMKLALFALDIVKIHYTQSRHINEAIAALKEQLAQPEQEPVAKYCCRLCFNKSGSLLLDRMILCSECGNKRCPKATNHELQCTNSNAPNQAGSIYNTPPQRTEEKNT